MVKSTETRSRMMMAGGECGRESVFNGCRVSGWEDEDAETDGGNGWTTVLMYSTLNCMLRSDENGSFDARIFFHKK